MGKDIYYTAARRRYRHETPIHHVEEAHRRALALDKLDIIPFAQPYRDYDGGEPTKEQRRLARWVNMRAAFKSCKWEDFRG